MTIDAAFSNLSLPDRGNKPRSRGLTMMIDWGIPPGHQADITASAGLYVDMAKIAASHHASAEDLAHTSQEAGVGALVFSHVVPPLGPNEEVLKAISKFYDGRIIPGEDLLRL